MPRFEGPDRSDKGTSDKGWNYEDGHTVDTPDVAGGRLAGIDFGTVRIGLALSDPSRTWVTPLTTYQRRSSALDAAYFAELAASENISGWVVGLPIHLDGRESQKSAEVRKFAAWLGDATRLQVFFQDERFTTSQARELLSESSMSGKKKKQRLDGFAAHLILTHFLESGSSGTHQNNSI